MKENRSKNAYINYLNSLFNYEGIMENFPYLVKTKHDKALAAAGKYGSLLKKNDSIAFNVGFNEWKLD